MRRIYFSFVFVLIPGAVLSLSVSPTAAQARDPWALIAETNGVRASHGIPADLFHRSLMVINISPPSSEQTNPSTPLPTTAIIQPVQVATPKADGSIIHIVDDGQALWHIAEAYKVSLWELLALNGLTESSIIRPGDELVIHPATTQVPSPSPTAHDSLNQVPAGTKKPTVSPTKKPATPTSISSTSTQAALAVAATPGVAESPKPPTQSSLVDSGSGPDYLLLAIGGLGLAGVALVVLGSILRRDT